MNKQTMKHAEALLKDTENYGFVGDVIDQLHIGIIDLRGSMLMEGPGRPGVGVRAELIALVDSETGLSGRAVWTDDKGDQVYSTLQGEGTAANNRITGTILGGTGRYAGATGSYEFSWRFVLEAEDGTIQGSASGLKGRFRRGEPDAGDAPP